MRNAIHRLAPWFILLALVAAPFVCAYAEPVSRATAVAAADGAICEAAPGDAGICETTMPIGAQAVPAVPDPSSDPVKFFDSLWDAITGKRWMGVVALVLVALVWLIRKKTPLTRWLPFLGTRWGGWALTLAASVIATVANAILCGKPYTFGVFLSSLYVGFLAAGGWELLRDLFGSAPAPARAGRRK